MTTEERSRKLSLAAKEYPVRIKTARGKFLINVMFCQKDEYGLPSNFQPNQAEFDTLGEAVEWGIRWKEARYS